MSDEHPLELEPPGEEPDAAPVVRRKRRLRGKDTDESPNRRPRGKITVSDAPPETGWLHRIGRFLVSTTSFYVVGFLTAVGLLLILYNPFFGETAAWPHELLGLGSAPFAWNFATTTVITLAAVMLAYLVALLMPSGPWRAGIVISATALVLATILPNGDMGDFALFVALALAAGATMVRPEEGYAGSRRVVLLVGVALLAVYLFMPWGSKRLAEAGVTRTCYGTAEHAVQVLRDVDGDTPAPIEEHAPVSMGTGFFAHLLTQLPVIVGCLLLLFGVAALVGLGWGWMRWAAGFLLLGLFLATALSLYFEGPNAADPRSSLASWQQGLDFLGVLSWNSLAYALPLAGAVAEVLRKRRS